MAKQLPGLEAFEFVTDRGNKLPVEGRLLGWGDEVQHDLVQHKILKRAGIIHQSQRQGPRHFQFSCLLSGGDITARYKEIERLLAAEPFGLLTHPRYGSVAVVFAGLRSQEDLDVTISNLTVEISFVETGLREVQRDSALVGAQRAATEAAALVVASPAGLQTEAQALEAAVVQFRAQVEELTGPIIQVAGVLNSVRGAVDAYVSAAGTAVSEYLLVAQARLVFGLCLQAYNLAGEQRPPIITYPVDGAISLARLCARLYGGGAQALEEEVLALNRIPTPYAIPAGVRLLLPDPASVVL